MYRYLQYLGKMQLAYIVYSKVLRSKRCGDREFLFRVIYDHIFEVVVGSRCMLLDNPMNRIYGCYFERNLIIKQSIGIEQMLLEEGRVGPTII